MPTMLSSLGGILLLTAVLAAGTGRANPVTLASDEWCPFICAEDTIRPGLLIEVATEAFAAVGREATVTILPWERAIQSVAQGQFDGLLGTDSDESPDLEMGPSIGLYREAMARRRNTAVDYDALGFSAAPQTIRLGLIAGYDYSDSIHDYVSRAAQNTSLVQVLASETALEQNLRKLAAGRVDGVPEDAIVLAETIHDMDLQSVLEIVPHPETSTLHVGFRAGSPEGAEAIADMHRGMAILRASGRFDEILDIYDLTGF